MHWHPHPLCLEDGPPPRNVWRRPRHLCGPREASGKDVPQRHEQPRNRRRQLAGVRRDLDHLVGCAERVVEVGHRRVHDLIDDLCRERDELLSFQSAQGKLVCSVPDEQGGRPEYSSDIRFVKLKVSAQFPFGEEEGNADDHPRQCKPNRDVQDHGSNLDRHGGRLDVRWRDHGGERLRQLRVLQPRVVQPHLLPNPLHQGLAPPHHLLMNQLLQEALCASRGVSELLFHFGDLCHHRVDRLLDVCLS
mmetsp:Transcript_8541/g.20206  ORF Transcript_8541/g.20206 Transcript_8541/m.20206 type:complete len:248 (+) Transcript_8541:436-1179(+)